MKTKDFSLDVKSVDDGGTFEGYASVFGVKDTCNEVVMSGAFSESLAAHFRQGSMPAMLWQHDHTQPIGVWESLKEDGKGLHGVGRLLKGVRQADEAHIMLKAKAVRGLSIGYREVEVEPGEVKKLNRLDLLEASIVTFPANRRARVDLVKQSLEDGDLPSLPDFEKFLREAGFSKTQAVAVANRGLAYLLRSESEGLTANALAELRAISIKL